MALSRTMPPGGVRGQVPRGSGACATGTTAEGGDMGHPVPTVTPASARAVRGKWAGDGAALGDRAETGSVIAR